MDLFFFLYLAAMRLLPHFSRLCQLLQLPAETLPATRVLESSQPQNAGCLLFVLEVSFAVGRRRGRLVPKDPHRLTQLS